ncbi:MAG TPA: transposase [Candidatus Acidoferrales bacterium]|nr:transposase [Candidatus Acidoferrales bacterium]
MANKLIRIYGRGHLHFITFSCYRRVPFLRSVRARNTFVQILGEVRDRYGFSLVGYVVMPEHIHLLIGEPTKGTPSTAIQVLKQRVSRRLRRRKRANAGQLNLNFEGAEDLLPRFWQRRFYDFNVWSLKKRVEKLHYMHMNPLKRKLVDHPKDWPWSSFSFYSNSKHGLIRVDPVR